MKFLLSIRINYLEVQQEKTMTKLAKAEPRQRPWPSQANLSSCSILKHFFSSKVSFLTMVIAIVVLAIAVVIATVVIIMIVVVIATVVVIMTVILSIEIQPKV